jgi:EAL domain-containing protein (putative c-di-GMP-specific phosphodiesterase class I)/ActR/RegA family two-component response regulator
MTNPGVSLRRRALVVDDDPDVLLVVSRTLREAGFEVATAADGRAALATFESGGFDAVVSDINMPALDGIQLLRALRERDLDIPVILLTGQPSVATAVRAVELGAFRYVQKPFDPDELVDLVTRAADLERLARLRRQLVEFGVAGAPQIDDRAGLEVRFASALRQLYMVFQPIVAWPDRTVLGYEALMRSAEPTLPHPAALLDAAERLDRMFDLGRTVRAVSVRALPQAPADALLFVNLHSSELADPELTEPHSPLAVCAPRVVLEITERARLEQVSDVPARIRALRTVGYRIALDDIGAGYAGLTSWALLEPDIVKLDMALVRDVHLAPTKRKLVGSVVQLCSDLEMRVVAEGVEKPEELQALMEIGCRYFQGYLFARPGPAFPAVDASLE